MNDITVMIKPSSYLCNLSCSYCFYCDEVNHRKELSSCENDDKLFMSFETVDNIINKVEKFADGGDIHYLFQGGEPLLIGTDFYEYFCSKAISVSGFKVYFSLQTNGMLIDDEFCKLFKKYGFLIGVSLDGPKKIHDMLRCGSYENVMESIALLKKYEIEFNILSVITKYTDAIELFEFYKSNDFRYVQTIYCLDPIDGIKCDYSLDANSYVRFRKRFFNCWFKTLDTDSYISVRDLENLMYLVTNEEKSCEQCGVIGECRPNLVIESDGKCYPCDFYCIDDFYCMNINENNVDDMLKSNGLEKFMNYDTEKNQLCLKCMFYIYCKCGCKRFRKLFNEIDGYCPQRDFLSYFNDRIESV